MIDEKRTMLCAPATVASLLVPPLGSKSVKRPKPMTRTRVTGPS